MLDQVKDVNHSELYRILKDINAPEFVKEAAMTDEEDTKELPGTSFADPSRRLYPLHTKADTWMSAAFFYKHASDNKQVEDRILKAASMWEVDVDSIKTSLKASIEKQASDTNPAYEVLIRHGDKVYSSIPINSAADLEKTASHILENAAKMPYAVRKDACEQILDVRNKLNTRFTVDMSSKLQKTAGAGTCTADQARYALKIRKALYRERQPEFIKTLEGITETLDKTASDMVAPPVLEKIANIFDYMDRFTELHHKYAKDQGNFKLPEFDLFHVTKADIDAFNANSLILSNGAVFNKHAAVENPLIRPFLNDVFGIKVNEDSEVLQKLAELDGPEADMVTEILEG